MFLLEYASYEAFMSFSMPPHRRISAQETGTLPIEVTQRIKNAAELLTVLAVGSYAIGFVIVNTYLLQFGYSGHALFKTTYISAGILFLLIGTLLAIPFYSTLQINQQGKDTTQGTFKRQPGTYLLLFSVSAPFFIAFGLMKILDPTELSVTYEGTNGRIVVAGLAAMGLALVLWRLENTESEWPLAIWAKKYSGLSILLYSSALFLTTFKIEVVICLASIVVAAILWMLLGLDSQSILHRLRISSPDYAMYLAGLIIISMSAMKLFGTMIYGHITPQYGGGQPAHVRVLIGGEKMTALSLQGAPHNLATLLADAQLVDSSEKELLLLLKATHDGKGLLLQVDRSIVDAVLYLPSFP